MAKEKRGTFRLERLQIENFKAIDSLDLHFPEPLMEDDLDVVVIGSSNGVGKTSVLEAITLLNFALLSGASSFSDFSYRLNREIPVDFSDMFIRAGTSRGANLKGTFKDKKNEITVEFEITRRKISVEEININSQLYSDEANICLNEGITKFFGLLAGLHSDPVIMPGLTFFHSYRKVQERNPDLSAMAGAKPRGSMTWEELFSSPFKMEMLRCMMGKADLFEGVKSPEAEVSLKKLNELVLRYTGGTINKLKNSEDDDTMDFRVTPNDGGDSFSFNGLSSGQKEIIATMFLIWKNMVDEGSIILIDEPELHLNKEWHMGFVRQLKEIAPNNQYILATHSESVAGSVDPRQRILLEVDEEGAQ